ncbi:MAG: CHAT domain-containing protein [Terriglobales bacterium]
MASSAPTLDLRLLTEAGAWASYCEQNGPPGLDVFAQLAELLVQAGRQEPASWIPAAEQLLRWARASDGAEAVALAERARGNLAFLGGDYAQAVAQYRAALAGFAGDVECGRTWSSLLHPLAMLGDHAGSLAAAEQARACFERAGDHHRLARLDINLASVWFRQDQFAKALEAIERAQAGLDALSGVEDQEAWAAIRVTRAVILINLARFDEAEQAYREARDYALAQAMPGLAAQADYNIGYLYFLRGQNVKAIRALDQARATANASQDKLHRALCDLDEADVCIELNLYEDALQLAHDAWEQFQAQGQPYEQGKALANMAVAEQFLGHDGAALELLERSEEAFAAASNDFWVQMTHLYRAVVLLRLGRYFEAMALARRAGTVFEQRGASTKAIYAGILLGQACLQARDREGAEAALRQAQQTLAPLYAPWLVAQAQMLAGELAEAQGEPAAALAAYEDAMNALESMRGQINFDELRISLLRDKSQIYQRAVALRSRASAPSPEAVWRLIERAKSRALAQVTAGGFGAITARGEGSRVVYEINRLREELNWYYRQLNSDQAAVPAPRGVEQVLQTIQNREQQLLRATRALGDEHLGVLEPEAQVRWEEAAAVLGPAALVEYFPCGAGYVAIAGNARELRLVSLPAPRSAVEGALRLFRLQVSPGVAAGGSFHGQGAALLRAVESQLRLLYQLLLAPLAAWLEAPQLVIVPHGMLHAVPFSALQDEHGPLLSRVRIACAPSTAAWVHARRQPPSPHRTHLAIVAEAGLAPEQTRCLAASGASLLAGAGVTAEAVRQQAATSARIFIAAGARAQSNPNLNALKLSDGWLNVVDIHNLRLAADLVVLTGQGVALGDLSRGDESIRLPRAFLSAGARAVVATLWDAGDHVNAEFLERLHAGNARPLGEAVHAAQLEMRRRYAHPYYWAGFQLRGALD